MKSYEDGYKEGFCDGFEAGLRSALMEWSRRMMVICHVVQR